MKSRTNKTTYNVPCTTNHFPSFYVNVLYTIDCIKILFIIKYQGRLSR